MLYRKYTPNPKYERGQSLTELAVGMLFMILLLAGLVELGRIFFSYMTLRDAVQEGALYASLHPTNDSGIAGRVRGVASGPLNMGNITVNVNRPGGACAGHSIEVIAEYQFQVTMPFFGAIVGSQTIPLRATVTDDILMPPCN